MTARYAYRLGWRSLRRIVPTLTVSEAKRLARDLGQAMVDHEITTSRRAAAFIAQVAHESGGFRYRTELWGPTPTQRGYEGRGDLGNVKAGDGSRFRGRGYIQITGRANYTAAAKGMRLDAVDHPELLATHKYAARSAAWWWKAHGCNELADRGDFVALTRRINGGTNGLADRQRYHRRARPLGRFLTPKRRKP